MGFDSKIDFSSLWNDVVSISKMVRSYEDHSSINDTAGQALHSAATNFTSIIVGSTIHQDGVGGHNERELSDFLKPLLKNSFGSSPLEVIDGILSFLSKRHREFFLSVPRL